MVALRYFTVRIFDFNDVLLNFCCLGCQRNITRCRDNPIRFDVLCSIVPGNRSGVAFCCGCFRLLIHVSVAYSRILLHRIVCLSAVRKLDGSVMFQRNLDIAYRRLIARIQRNDVSTVIREGSFMLCIFSVACLYGRRPFLECKAFLDILKRRSGQLYFFILQNPICGLTFQASVVCREAYLCVIGVGILVLTLRLYGNNGLLVLGRNIGSCGEGSLQSRFPACMSVAFIGCYLQCGQCDFCVWVDPVSLCLAVVNLAMVTVFKGDRNEVGGNIGLFFARFLRNDILSVIGILSNMGLGDVVACFNSR